MEEKGKKVKKDKGKKKATKKNFSHETDPFNNIRFVSMTEKSIQMIEFQNKLVFIVNRKSEKDDIKKSVENMFQTPVRDVKTVVDQKGRKKAFVTFEKEGEAGEIAIRLGII